MAMITYAEAVAAIDALICIPKLEPVPLSAALGMVTAEEVRLREHQPPFDRSTMDGYAVVLNNGAKQFQVKDAVHAGTTFQGTLKPGECVRITTGAPCPEGTTVIPLEATDRGTSVMTVTDDQALAERRNIAWRGEDGHAGDIVVGAGTRISPTTIAAAAMCGCTEITVCWPPDLAIVTTGDEVGVPGGDRAQADNKAGINDSNGPFLQAFAHSLGLSSTQVHAKDEANSLREALEMASDNGDIIVTTGGVSAGDKDLVPPTAAKLGFKTIFHHVAMQPGKPVFLAERPGKNGARFLIGLPGNPVAVVATAHLLLLPLVGRMMGGWKQQWLELPLTRDWQNKGQRPLFLPAKIIPGGVEPIAWNGSGDLLAAAAGDGLIELPAKSSFSAGQRIQFLPYVGLLPGDRGILPPRKK
jgi:molybdopterin molybdotransferase